MRKQTRPEPPELFVRHREKWTQQWINLRKENPSAKFPWYQADKQTAYENLLPVLKTMNQEHCAFCDGFPVDAVSNETIEHFQPKSDPRFEANAYEWANLFYCCDTCQREKRSQWDDALLRPDADDYTCQRYFRFDYFTGQMTPNPMATETEQVGATATIRLYGLDTSARRRARRRVLDMWQQNTKMHIDEFAYRDFLESDQPTK